MASLRLWLHRLLWLSLPWSIEWPLAWGVQLWWPAELMAGLLAVLFWLHQRSLSILFRHPWVTVTVAWGWAAAIVSAFPMVSLKSMTALSAFVTVFYFSAATYPQEERHRWGRYSTLSLAGVVLWTLFRHGIWFHWRADQANLAPMPFFPDHNMYAAMAAAAFFLVPAWWSSHRRVCYLLMVLFGLAVCASTSRAALGSWLLATGVAFMLHYFPQWKAVVLKSVAGLLVLLLIAMVVQPPVLARFFQRDVSLAERWNRYDCAARMAAARPWAGFGPGTFSLAYLPWQQPKWRTRISIDTPLLQRDPSNFGRGGGAHSEYLKILAETGWPGFVLFLCLWGAVFIRLGQHIIFRENDVIWPFAALTTLLFHFLVNDYLQDIRIAAVLWNIAATAMFSGDFYRNQASKR